MSIVDRLRIRFFGKIEAEHLRRGRIGELAAKRLLKKQGMKFLLANYRAKHGEIDLIFRDPQTKGLAGFFAGNEGDCLVFVEVKTRSSEDWNRPSAAVDADKRRKISKAALEYLALLDNPRVKFRFDIVEVLLPDGNVREIRHLPNAFNLSHPYRCG